MKAGWIRNHWLRKDGFFNDQIQDNCDMVQAGNI